MQPATSAERLRRRRLLAHTLLAAAFLLCAALALYPPAHHSFYPSCPVHEYLGILCPGCGATRALSALLHGHLADALHLNLLFVLLLPIALTLVAESYRRAVRPGAFRWPQPSAASLYATLAATVLFTITRNLAR